MAGQRLKRECPYCMLPAYVVKQHNGKWIWQSHVIPLQGYKPICKQSGKEWKP
jgi:hypothetical protein